MAMRVESLPGEDTLTVPPPSYVAPKLIDMIMPSYKENLVLFNTP
jgi:hypothetical protein